MSIATRTGDDGTTALLFGRRVPKTDRRIATNGALDELNAALGLARAHAHEELVQAPLLAAQKELVNAMGEIAVLPEDRPRYREKGFTPLAEKSVEELDRLIAELEERHVISFRHWATPGATVESAFLDVARTVCRRAEREVLALAETGAELNPVLLRFLNRLSDACWLLARYVETKAGVA
ncbi:MAG TPA: cob(I)yrinic acid a,c-diamide adenosyltransferase [Chthoniobacteraceae bacterium]|jgi:cob(I)alamin adenosyltransferase|nr:cob(I)yrinic acid a,c-diamide adenosyltransferase [Chthoniobacteraceae bacterium]